MKIGITGGTGYVASVVAPLIGTRGTVELIDLRDPVPGSPHFTFHKVDVSDPEAFREIATRYDVILHLAAVVGYPACRANPKAAYQHNVVTTENVLRLKKPGARVLLTSTISAYGDQPEGALVDELTDAHPNSVYGNTKKQAEDLILKDGPHCVLRFAGAFGASPRMRHDVLIHDFVRQAVDGASLSIYEDHFVRQFVHVRDMAAAVLHCLDHWDDLGGNIFNVGNPQVELTKRDLALAIAKQCPFPFRFEDSGQDLEKRNYRVAFRKFVAAGYRPEGKLENGIEELIAYYRRHPKELAHAG